MGGLRTTNLFDILSGAFLVQVLEKYFPADYAWWTSFFPSDTATDFLDLEKFRVSAKGSFGKVAPRSAPFKTTLPFFQREPNQAIPSLRPISTNATP